MSAKYWVGTYKDALAHSFCCSSAISGGGIGCVVCVGFLLNDIARFG